MDLKDWKLNASKSQQNYSNLLNDRIWEQYCTNNEKQLLWNKIAFVICGCKEEYSGVDKKITNELLEKCIKYGKKGDYVYIAFLFVCAYQNKDEGIHVPLIRVMKDDGKVSENSYFIDHVGRVYTDWSNFLNENIFDRWLICVPKKGIYSDATEEVEIEFYDQTTRGQTLQQVDKISTVSNVATSIAMLTGTIMSFTPLAPIGVGLLTVSAVIGAPGAVYGTGRSISKLVDRGQHDQSISLSNDEARGCWLSTVAGVLSFGNMASVSFLAKSAAGGNLVSAGVRTFCTTLNVTTISMNGVGILNSVFELANKKSEDITALDILQLSTSIFFFTNSLVNFKTANEIVKDAQKATIDTFRNNLKDEQGRMNFEKTLRLTKKQSGKMHGSADFIRGVKRIDNKQDFFQALGIDGNLKAKFNRRGMLNINNELIIAPKDFMQINEIQRAEILKNSNDLLNKKITAIEFNRNVQNIAKDNNIEIKNQRKIIYVKTLANAFKPNENEILLNLEPHEIDRLDNVFKGKEENYYKKYLLVGIEFAKIVGCKFNDFTEFLSALKFIKEKIDEEIKAYIDANPNYTIKANIKATELYFELIYKKYMELSNGKLAELKWKFAKQRKDSISLVNDDDEQNLFTKVVPDNHLSVERYFEIAREMTSQPITPKNSKITQNGESVCITYNDPSACTVTIRFDNIADGNSIIATLMYDDTVFDTRFY